MSEPSKTYAPVVSVYEKLAPIYDWIYRGYLNGVFAVALDRLRLTGRERLLDIACGTGELERRILAQHPDQPMVGVDITEAMLARARAKCAGAPHIEFHRAESQALPFPPGDFDIVVSCSALHYMREPGRFFAEAARVLKPGGRFLLIDWSRDYFRGKFYNAWRSCCFRSHHRVYAQREVETLLREADLTLTHLHRFIVQWIWGMMCVEARKT
ncbi:MAG: class I SAM-dependent methyltransferase [Deltaproteobacteria bacterium]|nr:class I SAM-dependent methyltransferase [Deltaproteobacteria bacterium]